MCICHTDQLTYKLTQNNFGNLCILKTNLMSKKVSLYCQHQSRYICDIPSECTNFYSYKP